MPISQYLDDQKFDFETKRAMGLPLEMARVVIERQRGDKANGFLAKRIIELARAGEREPDKLCEGALKIFRPQRK